MRTTTAPVRAAVITGGHPYDVIEFRKLFRSFPELDVYVQHMDDFAASPQEVRDSYGVVLFYTMLRDGPADDDQAWHTGKPRTALERLGQTKQGLFLLHHSILAYPQWPVWNQMVGIEDRKFDYFIGETVHVEVVRGDHPVTSGLKNWTMTDETYTMCEPAAGSEVLLTTQHLKSMKSIAWTRRHGQARVFCFESGHDNLTWVDPNFREVLRRGMLWCAGRL